MDKATVAKLAVKTAARYPRPTVGGAKFMVRHRGGVLQSIRTSRKAQRKSQAVIARVSDPWFRAELIAAMSALGVAATRAQKVGAKNAFDDKRVREHMRRATSHLTAALREEPKPKSHKLRNVALVGVLAGGTLVAVKARSALTGS